MSDEEEVRILIKVEMHNHPTAISPYPGVATGKSLDTWLQSAFTNLEDLLLVASGVHSVCAFPPPLLARPKYVVTISLL